MSEPPTPGWKIPQFEKKFCNLNFFDSNGGHGDDSMRCLHSHDQYRHFKVPIMWFKATEEVYYCSSTSDKENFQEKKWRCKRKRCAKKSSSKSKRGKRTKKKRKQTIILTKQSERNQQVKMIVCLFALCVVICV